MFIPMLQCYTPCIYYHEVHDKTNKPSVRIICDYKDGQEIKNIPNEEIINCPHFKTLKQVKQSRLNNKILF